MKTPFETHRQEAFVSDMSAWLDLFFEPLIPSTRREEISNTASGHETVSPNDLERFIVAIEKQLSELIPNFLAWRVAIHGNASDFTDLIFFDEGAPLDPNMLARLYFPAAANVYLSNETVSYLKGIPRGELDPVPALAKVVEPSLCWLLIRAALAGRAMCKQEIVEKCLIGGQCDDA